MHSILARQLRRLGLNPDEPPAETSVWQRLLSDVGQYYETLEHGRNRLHEALRESNQQIRSLEEFVSDLERQRTEPSLKHYQNLFERSPVPTWEENFRQVALWLDHLRSSGVGDLERHLEDNPEDLLTAVSLIEVTNVNKAAARLVGAAEEAVMLGPLDPLLVDDESAPSFVAQLMALWNGSDSLRLRMVGKTLDSDPFDAILEWHAPRMFRLPDYSRVLVTIVDISEEKAAERRAQERLKSKDELIASVSHELRTPLTSVLGFAELLRSMDKEDYAEERDSLLGVISSQATDLSDLVEDLLVAARSELGQLSVVAVPVNIHAQIAQVLEGRALEDEHIQVPPRPTKAVMASGDPQRVRQILRNMITNASRYGGPEMAVVIERSDEEVTVRVNDNGDGLEPGDEDRVFDRYVRKTGSGANHNSVGIGLTIARDLATKMGGDLTYSRAGGWTSFALSLPVFVEPDGWPQP